MRSTIKILGILLAAIPRVQSQPRLAHTTVLRALPRRRPSSFSSSFSTHAVCLDRSSNRTKSESKESSPVELEPPTMSFQGLGLSKNMKVFLIGILGVFGSLETWFWCKAIWTWWKGSSEDGGEVEQ